MVIVSNRVSAVRHADNIVVIDDGRVVDQGTHHELRARPGFYQDICGVQDMKRDLLLLDEALAPRSRRRGCSSLRSS